MQGVIKMLNQNQIQDVVNSVLDAQQAVIDAQGNRDPGRYQHAQNLLQQAKQLLHETVDEKVQKDPDQEKQLIHAQDLIRQLDETQHSIEATD
jgi:hypothetical protein